MPAKKIVAMFALAAQAQDAAPVVPGEGERIFSDSLNGVSVENFLDAMTTDYESSYIYEEVVPDNNEYDLFSYDGTDGNAGRPNGNDDYDGKELDASQLFGNDPNNADPGNHTGKNSSHNECRQCSGVDFATCQGLNAFETCNDAQDACIVQIRSELQGTTTVHKVYSGCSARQACEAQASKNFLGTESYGNDFSRNQCKGISLHRRFYSPSKCVFCTKLGNSSTPNTVLFGSNTSNLYISGSSNPSFNAIFTDPYAYLRTVYTDNDWYATQRK